MTIAVKGIAASPSSARDSDDDSAQNAETTSDTINIDHGTTDLSSMPVWEDDDDQPSENAPTSTASEPEWVLKRRRVISESRDDTSSTSAKIDVSTLTGKLTKVKPGRRSSGIRFLIQRHTERGHNLSVSGGVSQLSFDESNRLFAILGRRDKSIRLFEIDRHRSEGHHFGLKGESKSSPSCSRPISSFAFADGGRSIFLIDGQKSVLRYDCQHGVSTRIATINSPRTAYGYRRIYTPSFSDDQNGSMFALCCTDRGGVLLCDSRSSAIMHHFQMNATAVGIGFHLRAGVVITADSDANIYEWDLVSGRCVHKFRDEHSLRLSCFESSPMSNTDFSRNAYISCGSRMGFLNLYPIMPPSDATLPGSHIQQDVVKTYGNLSTGITAIAHESNGRFIAYGSEHKRNALRIIHNPSGQVVSNWPIESVNLGRVTALSFCARSSTLAVGNRMGKVQLFRILTT
ncbi:WD-40 repeat protein, putative [Babesia ovis]|uniref:WD-40 repeat protein, putative n=1 Tax=Babesia ovis TaxID=5869 RepID=A0A9W5TBQ5_BABOV|nr:WD-40 repeat protein, putative [Babesia ovis]